MDNRFEYKIDMEYKFPLWLGEELNVVNNPVMQSIDISWHKRDVEVFENIRRGIGVFNVRNRGKSFDIELSGGDNIVKYSCEFRDLGYCNWNQQMVVEILGKRYYYTLLNVNIKAIAHEHGRDYWESHLTQNGFFYIVGDVDMGDDGRVHIFNISKLCYKSYLMVNNEPVSYVKVLIDG